jgi:iron complex outermembrane recepter protein
MPARFPGDMGSPQHLERQFNKDIYSLNIRNYFQAGRIHNLSAGLNAEYQENRIGGYAFIIPQFEQLNLGAYLYDRIMIGYRTWLHAGIRIDNGALKTKEYADWFPTPVPDQVNGADQVYLTRSEALNRTFNSLSMSLGVNRNTGRFALMANIGKGFRMPTAKEVAANGVNYHYFRYEKGNPSLKAEDSWQADLNLEYSASDFGFQISPFFNYFPGYIYLDPSYRHDHLYGAGNQIFEYTQNEVLRFGGEVRITFRPFRFLSAELAGDYVYSEQLSGNKKGFSIPFSPPPSVMLDIKYSPGVRGSLQNPFIGVEAGLTGSQERIVPPERPTPAYELVHLSMGGDLIWNGRHVNFNLRIHNLLDRKYLNHLSYYRLIGAPEPGRSFIFSLKVPFGN